MTSVTLTVLGLTLDLLTHSLLHLANDEKTCDITLANTADLDAVVSALKQYLNRLCD